MATRDRLKVILRRLRDDKTFKPRTIWADRNDADVLHEVLLNMARELDNQKGNADEWADSYELHVKGVDRMWIDFRVLGRKG